MFQVEEFIKIMDPIKFAKTSLLLQIAELYTLIANMEGNLIYFVLIKWLSTCFKVISENFKNMYKHLTNLI